MSNATPTLAATREAVETLQSKFPFLCGTGLATTSTRYNRHRTADEILYRWEEQQIEIIICIAWIKQQTLTRGVSYQRTSYGIKHRIENQFPEHEQYIGNTSLIIAAQLCGLLIRQEGSSPNAYFNLSASNVKTRRNCSAP